MEALDSLLATGVVSPGRQCRICLEDEFGEEAEAFEWVSPCECSGTQKWVHLPCLRAWQASCLKNNSLRKASNCSVCHGPFSYPPIQENLFLRVKAWVCKGAKPSHLLWPALFTLPLLFLVQIVVASLAFSMVSSVAKMVFSPIRILRGTHSNTARLPSIHSYRSETARQLDAGIPLPREQNLQHALSMLRPGALLVASSRVKDGVFAQAIVLLERYDRAQGARGVIINKRFSSYERSRVSRRGHLLIEHNAWAGSGGPLSQGTMTVLHDMPGIPGSFQLASGLFVGHYASSRYLELEQASNARIKLLFGNSIWNPNQLEREIAAGIWTVFPCPQDEVASTVFSCT